MDVFVARQPIYDREQNVIAYELLYRKSEINSFDQSVPSSVATSVLLMNSYYSFGLNNLIENHMAFINFSKSLIENDIPLLLNESNVVIELLETIKPDPFFINKIKHLKSQGYTLALDDFIASELSNELIDYVDIIKVDFLQNTKVEITQICNHCKRLGKTLLAEKVETHEEFVWAKRIGYDLFQGYVFSKPSVLKSKSIPESLYQYIRLIEKLNMPEPDYKEISSIIEVDVTLTYKLLKLVNSRFALVQNIISIQHALSILGITAFRKWLSLALVQNHMTPATSELVKVSMIRAHFMENITKASSLKNHVQECTLVGILSAVDVLLETPMQMIVESLPLSSAINDTLLSKESPYSMIYLIVLDYEQGRFESLQFYCSEIEFDINKLPRMYADAVQWAEDLFLYMQ